MDEPAGKLCKRAGRLYLDGEEVTPGDHLELRAIEWRATGGRVEPVPIDRWETVFYVRVAADYLETFVGGHSAAIYVQPWMEFRWPAG